MRKSVFLFFFGFMFILCTPFYSFAYDYSLPAVSQLYSYFGGYGRYGLPDTQYRLQSFSDMGFRYDSVTGTVTVPQRSVTFDYYPGNSNTGTSGITTYLHGFGSASLPAYSFILPKSFNTTQYFIYDIPVSIYVFYSSSIGDVDQLSFNYDLSFLFNDDTVISGLNVNFPDGVTGRLYKLSNGNYSLNTSGIINLRPGSTGFFSVVAYVTFMSPSSNVSVRMMSDNFNSSASVSEILLKGIADSLGAGRTVDQSAVNNIQSVGSSIGSAVSSLDSFESSAFDAYNQASANLSLGSFNLSGLAAPFALFSSIANQMFNSSPDVFQILFRLILAVGISSVALGIAVHLGRHL